MILRIYYAVILDTCAVQGHIRDFLKCKGILHPVFEPDAVVFICAYVLGQCCSQLERNSVADVVVGAVLPAARNACRVIGILDLFLEFRGTGFVVGKFSCRYFCGLSCGDFDLDIVVSNQDHSLAFRQLTCILADCIGAGHKFINLYFFGSAVSDRNRLGRYNSSFCVFNFKNIVSVCFCTCCGFSVHRHVLLDLQGTGINIVGKVSLSCYICSDLSGFNCDFLSVATDKTGAVRGRCLSDSVFARFKVCHFDILVRIKCS